MVIVWGIVNYQNTQGWTKKLAICLFYTLKMTDCIKKGESVIR